MFFDEPLDARKHARIRQLPPVPDTGWVKPESFPNLVGNVAEISFDTETKEFDDLDTNGPGWGRERSHIIGVSIAARDKLGNRGSWYYPVRHEVETHDNLDPRNVFGWLGDVLNTPSVPKIGCNLTYDIGNLSAEGVKVTGQLDEVQFAEALIDSDAFVRLDVLGRKYLGAGKVSSQVEEWCREAYPNTPPTKWRADLYRAPPRLVGPYAIGDADMPIGIRDAQRPLLTAEGFDYVYRLECDLIPLMIRMRAEGVRVDLEKAEALLHRLKGETVKLYRRVYDEFGYNLQSTSSGNLGKLFDHVGIDYPRNEPKWPANEGTPQVRKEWLAALEHPLGDLLNDIREHEKICGTFLESYILKKNVGGKLYPQFHQLKGDENGTVVGRFSSSTPNLQNIPSRTDLGKLVRQCFVPDLGHFNWTKFDYSQIHYRILAHYAVGPGADELRARYTNDPKTDYHNDVYFNVAPRIGWSITDKEVIAQKRRIIKNVNFSLLYGVGRSTLAYKYLTGMTGKQVDDFFDNYYEGAPYVKPTMEAIGEEVQRDGYVTTLLGRRIRFNLFEPARRNYENPQPALPYREALAEYGSPLRRAFDYRGVNYKFQGSEPDLMKEGMRQCLNAGVFDYTGVPRLTVHDELDFSRRDNSPKMTEAFAFIKRTMQGSIKLRVPVNVDESTGPSWGKAD
jgi:DNA polymerase I-like protein with 3'-5' exonuclease and polymerase domains